MTYPVIPPDPLIPLAAATHQFRFVIFFAWTHAEQSDSQSKPTKRERKYITPLAAEDPKQLFCRPLEKTTIRGRRTTDSGSEEPPTDTGDHDTETTGSGFRLRRTADRIGKPRYGDHGQRIQDPENRPPALEDLYRTL